MPDLRPNHPQLALGAAIDRSRDRMQHIESQVISSVVRLERVKGIEPSYSAWKAAALPLSYTRAPDDLTRRADGLNPSPRPFNGNCSIGPREPDPALTGADSLPILMLPSTMKGGDPVSYTKRCHLAGIAR